MVLVSRKLENSLYGGWKLSSIIPYMLVGDRVLVLLLTYLMLFVPGVHKAELNLLGA